MPVCLNVCLVPAASNVLLDEHRTYVKLADLGSAQAIQEDRPRCFDDIWQIGCVLLFMLNGATSLLFYENVSLNSHWC